LAAAGRKNLEEWIFREKRASRVCQCDGTKICGGMREAGG